MNENYGGTFADPALQQAAGALRAGETDVALTAAASARERIDDANPNGQTLLKLAIKRNDERAVKGLLALGANPNHPSDAAPVAAAVEMANAEVVRALVDAGADPNGTANGESALWRAALGDRREVAELLLQRGASIDRGNRDGMTPALAAVKADNYRMALFLLQHGANPAAKTLSGTGLAEWARRSRIDPQSEEGQARERLYVQLSSAGEM